MYVGVHSYKIFHYLYHIKLLGFLCETSSFSLMLSNVSFVLELILSVQVQDSSQPTDTHNEWDRLCVTSFMLFHSD